LHEFLQAIAHATPTFARKQFDRKRIYTNHSFYPNPIKRNNFFGLTK